MDLTQVTSSLLGGALIGTAVTMLLFFNGRVAGISGIIASSLAKPTNEGLWRYFFIAGLIVGGGLIQLIRPDFFANTSDRSFSMILIAGLFVGYGTVMGSGCTSGHGICGISRLSKRSFVATATFMFFGFLTVQVVRFLIGGSL